MSSASGLYTRQACRLAGWQIGRQAGSQSGRQDDEICQFLKACVNKQMKYLLFAVFNKGTVLLQQYQYSLVGFFSK